MTKVRQPPHKKSRPKRKGGASIPRVTRVLTEHQQRKLRETAKNMLKEGYSYEDIKTTLYNMAREYGVNIGSSTQSAMYVKRLLRDVRAGQLGKEAVFKRPSEIDRLLNRGVITKEAIWDKYLRVLKRKKKEESMKDVYNKVVDWLIDNYGLDVDKKSKWRWRTFKRWLDANPIPPELEAKRIGVFDRWKNFSNPELNPLFKKFVEKARKSAKEKTVKGYIRGLKNFYDYLHDIYLESEEAKKKGHGKEILDPENWNAELIEKWIIYRYDVEKKSSNTLRGYLIGVRRFLEYALGWNRTQLREIGVKMFGGRTEKKKPTEIRYFPYDEFEKMISYIPDKDYTFTVGKRKRTLNVKSEQDKAMYEALLRTLMCTGARRGSIVTIRGIESALHEDDKVFLEDMFRKCHGIVSLRLDMLGINQRIPVEELYYDEKLRTMRKRTKYIDGVWLIKRLVEKRKPEGWREIPLTEKTENALRKYLYLRFKANSDDELELKINNYFEEKKKELFELKDKAMLLIGIMKGTRSEIEYLQKYGEDNLLKQALKAKTKEQKDNVKRYILRKIRDKYKELLVFPISPDTIDTLIYACVDKAQRKAKETSNKNFAILDDRGNMWTVEKIYEIPHVTHLLRKSFAQNLIEQDVPMEIIASYGVGWEDLTTLFWYYGRIPPAKKNRIFVQYVNKMF